MSAESAATRLQPCPFCGADHGESALRCPATDMVLPFAGRLLAGKFRFVTELGRGGMGAVWLARNIHVDRDVALKLILPEVSKNPEIVARFQNEARVAARIGHAGICDILDLEVTPLGPVIVMELLRGENLGQRIAREGRLTAPVAVGLIREALSALDAAHRAGIIHRDLKPENLFLHQPDVDAVVVKLMDFGISKFIDRAGALTANGVLMGTPEYMAPEQVNGAVHADARTDIWAIGAVLYKALTGVDAFTGATFPATLIAILTTEPEPIESRAGPVPAELSAVILRCLAKDPDERFQTARELADALKPFEHAVDSVSDRAVLGSLPTLHSSGSASPTIIAGAPEPERARSRWPARLFALVVLGAAGLGAWWYATEGPGAADPDVAAIVAGVRGTGSVISAALPEAPTLPNAHVLQDIAQETKPLPPVVVSPAEPVPVALDPAGTTGGVPEPAAETTAAADTAAVVADDPPHLIAAGDLVTPSVAGKIGNQHWAKEYCGALARNKYLAVGGWKLANPSEARRFAKLADIKAAGYWTSATHKGRGLVVWLPRGTDSSIRVSKKAARPLCVANKP